MMRDNTVTLPAFTMHWFPLPLLLAALFLLGCGKATPEPTATRPAAWAQPVAATSPENFFQVSENLFRSAYPEEESIAALQTAGIKTIINLRSSNDQSEIFQEKGFTTHWYKMSAGSVSEADLIAVLKLLRTSPQPALVHCWHGSDRTGFIVAGYRIIEQGWSKEDAIAELRRGGFGYHEFWYPNIPDTLNALDIETVKNALAEDNRK